MEGLKAPILKCRVCWEDKTQDVLVLVTTSWAAGSPKTIKDVILFCVPTLSIQDNSLLCRTCLWQLKFTYHFIERCLKTESDLVQKTTGIIQKLKLNGNNSSKLENVLDKSIKKGNKIKIIFENPEQVSNAGTANIHDHTYFTSSNQAVETCTTDPNNLVQDNSNSVKQEKQGNFDDDGDDWFNEAFTDEIDVNLHIREKPTKESKKELSASTTKFIPRLTFPQELVNLLDFDTVNVRCLTMQRDLAPDISKGLLDEGINIVNMSADPTKKKRVIYLTRDLIYCFNECTKCNLKFETKGEWVDHKHLHQKGKIKLPFNTPFSCNSCSGSFETDREFRSHFRNFHGVKQPHQCTKCSKKFSTHKELELHQELFKDSDKCKVKCTRCGREFGNKKLLAAHNEDVADAPCCDYLQCKVCSQKFTKEEYKLHIVEVHPRYQCPECGKAFPTNSGLSTHKRYVHNANQGMCHECGKIVKNEVMLRIHIERVHSTNVYMCDKCPRQFRSRFYLRKHAAKVHSGEKTRNFACEKCGKTFYNKAGLTQHTELLHLAPAKFICPTCGEGFVRNDYLKRHITFHEKYMKYSCQICKMSFSSESRLNTHQFVGHDENGKPLEHSRRVIKTLGGVKKNYGQYGSKPRPCVCNICHRVLANATTLKLHYKSHLRIRAYQCDKCGITLQTPGAYKNHLRKHDNPNFELSCNICHAYKSSRLELEAHIQQVHQNLKYNCKFCPAKFGRKHLLYSHESLKHTEEYEKKHILYNMLTSQHIVDAPENSWVSRTNKGRKLGMFEPDVDQELHKLVNSKQDQETSLLEGSLSKPASSQLVADESFSILNEEYQMSEEDRACKIIQDDMEINM